ncbi:lipoprotein signal peptidase [Corynebacterium pseudotuberculosis]|nr:Lipoprotein signal peptidase [Corynebacterium pseudotuberculosis 267]AJC14115.1 Lipoprotein signal peptidase [Corynebacterium pseudotuberculosis]AKC74144.1 Lipoprotein signal peptidase [Corynebacterium pseudotuberculosis]AKJ56055.1 Lipoprotein signal peptidase [Corynebacterium pseudotuberculosis]ALM77823.1 lipoprotein signal peptidase [Corynebacterium pseudotuberculosis]
MTRTDRRQRGPIGTDDQRIFIFTMAAIILSVATVDQASKAAVLHFLGDGQPLKIIGDWFRFRLLFNPGAAFSFGENATWLFTSIQLIFVVGIAWYAPKVRDGWTAVALAMIAGGALGNLIDRLFREPAFFVGHVVDFISIGNFAVFNVADSAITCGVAIFFVAILLESRRDAQQHQRSEEEVIDNA